MSPTSTPFQTIHSPDGGWQADYYAVSGEPAAELLKVSRAGKSKWSVPYDPSQSYWVGGLLQTAGWDITRSALYITTDPWANANFFSDLFYSGVGLYRLDLETGTIQQILPERQGVSLAKYSFSFSPDGAYLAYIRGSSKTYTDTSELFLTILELDSGQEVDTVLGDEYAEAGDIIWAPDGAKVAFALTRPYLEDFIPPDLPFTIDILDLDTGRLSTIVKDVKQPIYPRRWISDDTIELSDFRSYWNLDVGTGRIKLVATATPYSIK
jgi:dipeptidyl aminopeptidase/acylaminoacyl peptidase